MEISISQKMEEVRLFPANYKEDMIGCFFQEELEKQREEQDNQAFRELYNAIVDLVQSLPLMLLNLPRIVTLLRDSMGNKAVRKEVLALLPCLFRDCRQEVYPLFCSELMPCLVGLVAEREKPSAPLDLESLEQVFHVLAYALRYFFDCILRHFPDFLALYRDTLFCSPSKLLK